MPQNQDQFVVSVANVILRDTNTNELVLKGKTLLNSNLTQEVSNTEITGGKGNQLLYDWNHSKRLNVTIEDAVWRESYIALNNGVNIISETDEFYVLDEEVTLSSGSGSVENSPVSSLYVEKPDGTIVTIEPSGKDFTVSGLTDETVYVTYRYEDTIDTISIDADKLPSSYELTMFTEMYEAEQKLADVQILVPKFKPAGNFEINFASDAASTSNLEGKALTSGNANTYAKVKVKTVTDEEYIFAIASTPSDVTLASSETQQITTYGLRSGVHGNKTYDPSNSDLTYTSSDDAVATVDTDGLIEYVGVGTCTVTIEHTGESLTDQIQVECT